ARSTSGPLGARSSRNDPSSPAGDSPRNHGDENSTNENKPPRTEPSVSCSLGQSLASASTIEYPNAWPLWQNPKYLKHIVTGDFMKLSVKPKTVDTGEWLAYQGMSSLATRYCSYTWFDDDDNPIHMSAHQYMTSTQQWITAQFDNPRLFPFDPAGVTSSVYPGLSSQHNEAWIGVRSGFPKEFKAICRFIFRQMCRVYAHIYWNHFVEPFYHLRLEKHLNSCFCYFLHTAAALGMLESEDVKAMQPIIDIWAADGTLSPESEVYQLANVK
ncbi:hypothetical protein LLEC1_07155, partial [Akanthomyces lecanii]